MTEDDVRTLLFESAAPYATKRRGSTGIYGWCRQHWVNRSHANEFINGKRSPCTDLLNALGLEYHIAPLAPTIVPRRYCDCHTDHWSLKGEMCLACPDRTRCATPATGK